MNERSLKTHQELTLKENRVKRTFERAISKGTVESGRCWSKVADVWSKVADVKVADDESKQPMLGQKRPMFGLKQPMFKE